MAKRQITIRIDENLLEQLEKFDHGSRNRTELIEKRLIKGLRLL